MINYHRLLLCFEVFYTLGAVNDGQNEHEYKVSIGSFQQASDIVVE